MALKSYTFGKLFSLFIFVSITFILSSPALNTKPFIRLRTKGYSSVVPPLFTIHSMMHSLPDSHPEFAISGSPVPVYSPFSVFFGISPNDFMFVHLGRLSANCTPSLAGDVHITTLGNYYIILLAKLYNLYRECQRSE